MHFLFFFISFFRFYHEIPANVSHYDGFTRQNRIDALPTTNKSQRVAEKKKIV